MQKMFSLCRGTERFCDYDLSVISIDDYEGFFNGLPNIIYKKVDSIRFNLDLYHKYDDYRVEMSDEDQSIIDESIYTHKRRFPHYLFKILNLTLPKSRRLKSLEISGFRIPSGYVDEFIKSANKCRTLREIKLNGFSLELKKFQAMLAAWSPFRFFKLGFRNCNIDEEAKNDVLRYLQLTDGTKEWKLTELDLNGNNFKKEDLSRFAHILNKCRGIENEDNDDEKSTTQSSDSAYDNTSKSRSRSFAKRSAASKPSRLSEDDEYAFEEEEEEEEFFEEEEEEEEAYETTTSTHTRSTRTKTRSYANTYEDDEGSHNYEYEEEEDYEYD